MDSLTSLSSTESTAATRMISRRRPLHTCGVSILAIAHKAYTKAQDFNGPIGTMTKRLAKIATLASPFVYTMLYQWLAILSFADDGILAVENMVETLFPPSTHVFNKMDELVHIAETLPGKFDNAVNEVPTIIRQVPFLDWALIHAISWLNFFISSLTHWGSDGTREKEIMIDINCNELNNESASVDRSHYPTESPMHVDSENNEKFPPISDTPQAETKTVGTRVESDTMKCSYKEVLEKGTNENTGRKEDSPEEDIQKGIVSKEVAGEGGEKNSKTNNEGIDEEDPILELFESSWHMKPGRRGEGSSLSRSVSYT